MIVTLWRRYHHAIRQLALLSGEKGCRIVVVALTGALVARTLGPSDYGQLNLALSLAYVVSPLSRLGLEEILIRDIAREPSRSGAMVRTGMVLRFVGSLVPLLGCGIALALGLIPASLAALLPILLLMPAAQVLDTPSTYLLAMGRAGQVAATRLASLVTGAALRIGGVLMGAALPWFAVTYVIETAVHGLSGLFMARQRTEREPRAFDVQLAWQLLKECRYVAALYIVGDLAIRADMLILAFFTSAHEIGIYAFGMRFVEALYMLPVVAGSLVLPALAKQTSPAAARQLVVRLGMLACVGFGMLALVGAGLARPLVWLLGGPLYADSVAVVEISMIGLPLTAVAIVRYHYLVALGRLRLLALLTLLDASVTILVTTLFCWQWGMLGAAWAHGIARGLNLITSYCLVADLRTLPILTFGRDLLAQASKIGLRGRYRQEPI